MAAKQKNLETMQNAVPDLEGKSERIRQQIVSINQQRAQLAVDYKDSVRVREMNCNDIKSSRKCTCICRGFNVPVFSIGLKFFKTLFSGF